MKHTLIHQGKRAGIALAAVAAFTALGTGTPQAAPPANIPTFTTADISVNSVGFLECAFKEAGLDAGAPVDYTCGATDVGWVTQCFVRSKPVGNIPPRLHVAHNADGLTTFRTYFATNRGTITETILTAYPTVDEEVGLPLCPESEGVVITEEITAIRWCNGSLVDTTNGPNATVPELFEQLNRKGSGEIPSCETLATLPTDI